MKALSSNHKMSALFLALSMVTGISGLALTTLSTPAHAQSAADTAANTRVLGTLTLSEAMIRPTPAGAKVGGGFLVIKNTGAADTLVSVTSSRAATHELHKTEMADGVAKMVPMPKGIEIPANDTVKLKPGGLHIMFMDIKTPFVKDDQVEVTLNFAKAGAVVVPFKVKEITVGHPRADGSGSVQGGKSH